MTDILKSIFKKVGSSSSLSNNSAKKLSVTTFVRSEIDKPHFAPYDVAEASMYRHRRQVGMNLGSIFILDKQLAPPSLRSCVVNDNWESELEFLEACMTLEQAKEALEDHWSTYVTEKDFEYLASIGINSVRIPIGYWIVGIFSSGPFKKYEYVYKSAWRWFLNMVSIAAKYKIGVLVDLHGAPGGQNTLPHCGTSSHRAQFFRNSNQEMTLKILKKLAVELAPINNVIGLSVLNEPIDDSSLPNFYLSAYKTIRQATDIMLPIYICDAYDTKKYIDFIKRHGMKFVILDTHFPLNTVKSPMVKRRKSSLALSHHHFTSSSSSNPNRLSSSPTKTSNNNNSTLIKVVDTEKHTSLKQSYVQSHGNIIVGEWSAVKDLKLPTSIEEIQQVHDFSEMQLEIYTDLSSGHYFWNYRASDDGDCWSFVYCHKTRILLSQLMTGTIPMESVLEISRLAKSRLEKYAEMAFDQHVNHHKERSGKKKTSEEVDPNIYKQGFSDGYRIALIYLELYQSRVGFKQQLAHGYAVNKHHFYEQGFIRALFTVDQLIREFISAI